MEIIIGKLSGFCNGVNNAVTKAYQSLKDYKEVYCLGELVHNEIVINEFKNNGMIFVNDIELVPNNSNVIFRAHGESVSVYEKALEKNLNIIDLTCPKVKLIHKIIEKENDSFIILIGKKNHPECIASISYSKHGLIVYDDSDIENIEKLLKKTHCKKIYVLSQTTISNTKYNYWLDIIKNKFTSYEIKENNTICNATNLRQNETIEIAKKVTKLIVIGGKNSSNTKELETISKDYTKTFLIQDINDLKNIKFNNNDRVGLVAGASTPSSIIKEVSEYLKNVY